MKDNKLLWNVLAFATVAIWSSTFICSKILLETLTPLQLMFFRFVIAYIVLLILHPKFYKPNSIKEEFLFILTGISGGSLYFFTENTAVKLSLASDVSLIVATTPILTVLLAHLLTKEKALSKNLIIGFFIAISGVFLVIFNGRFILKLNPKGDLLALGAAFCWAIYSVIIKRFNGKYPTLYLTRKVFFYAIITVIPFLLKTNFNSSFVKLLSLKIIISLLFLGIVASSSCYVIWNLAIEKLGVIKTNNYLYFLPLITLVLSFIILHENITVFSLIGATLILLGVYVSERGFYFKASLRKEKAS